ncbi:ABC transporter substrate-binding protein [Caproiciproducens sp.]|uniref:ABC transporter substrate-binding protein n=1 Tax=Caproiciproducens sp. TaxID=1954376 RepID=UPI00289E5532|nr:extracellular solute-binding protein [Caproiciproducens sp.]
MKKSKTLAVLCALALMLSAAATGCSKPDSGSSTNSTSDGTGTVSTAAATGATITLSIATNAVGDQSKALQAIAQDFEKENPNIKVNFSAPGSDYESIMKVKMASNQLPDVFATHGWAVARYGNYLEDLSSESWASQVDDSIKPFITDSKGKLYVLPMDMDKTGINYNVDILKKYNVEVPKTWDEFLAACETIKTKSNGSISPVHVGGGDSWTQGQYFDFFATPAFLSGKTSYESQFKDGSFDWTKFDILPQNLLTLFKKGYLNKDYLTSKYEDSAKQMAQGKAAFTFYGPSFESTVLADNPKANIGLMPIPALKSGEDVSFVGGEKTTWGVWKDSKNIDAAKKFVSYFAKEENIKKVCKSSGLPSGLSGIEVDDGALTSYFKTYSSVKVYPYFDRECLPDGMWDVMTQNAGDMIAGSITPRQYSENMKSEFTRLKSQTEAAK